MTHDIELVVLWLASVANMIQKLVACRDVKPRSNRKAANERMHSKLSPAALHAKCNILCDQSALANGCGTTSEMLFWALDVLLNCILS